MAQDAQNCTCHSCDDSFLQSKHGRPSSLPEGPVPVFVVELGAGVCDFLLSGVFPPSRLIGLPIVFGSSLKAHFSPRRQNHLDNHMRLTPVLFSADMVAEAGNAPFDLGAPQFLFPIQVVHRA